jgi:hypothetical protein
VTREWDDGGVEGSFTRTVVGWGEQPKLLGVTLGLEHAGEDMTEWLAQGRNEADQVQR